MADYQPFLISEFKTGLYDYLQPWIRPQDAFDPLTNAYIYRGILQKRNGSTIFGNQLADKTPVMGIMQYADESSGSIALVVASEEYLYSYTPNPQPDSGTFTKITSVKDSPFWSGPVTAATVAIPAIGTVPTFWTNITPSTVTITAYDGSTVVGITSDDGAGGLSPGTGIFTGNTGAINYGTGAVSFVVTIATSYTLTLSIKCTVGTSPYFTGNITNFFNWCNWQPTSAITAIGTSYLYMTNGIDPVTLFDGTNMSRPGFFTKQNASEYIKTALDVKTYANRLLLLRPTLSTNTTNPANQDIYYSALYSPFNFINDIPGNGGAISAATGDRIVSAEFLRDNLLVAFSNSTWTFQVTGSTTPPFIFRRLNSSKSTQCPYAGVPYDERITNLGNTGFVACDGVNVQRFDIPVIDYYETQISQQYFNQDFSQRYDNLNQTWMFYPSFNRDETKFPVVDAVAPGSDKALIYNFLENTWATYANSFPMTCLGFFYVPEGTTWADLNVDPEDLWENTDEAWNSYGFQTSGRILLGGDTSGNIYHLDNPGAVRDGMDGPGQSPAPGTSFNVEIKTTRWNPFMKAGQKTQFGYIDVFYSVSSKLTDIIQITLKFFVDNSKLVAASRTLTLDDPSTAGNSPYAWKRIYCNLMGEFIQIEIDPSEDAPFQILGFVLWARPAGRFTGP